MSYFRFSPVLSILSSISRGYEPSEVKAGSFWLSIRAGKQFVIQLEASEVKAGSFRLAIRAGKQFVIQLEASEVKAGSFRLANGRGQHLVDPSGYPVDGERASVTQTQC